MPFPIQGKCYITQSYGQTDYARSATGRSLYKAFGAVGHPGIDFGTARINLPIVALVKGKVVRASLDGGWGNHVEVQGEDGWNRQYAHLSAMNVVVGQLVKPGDVLGKVGNTGASSATHLHYGNRRRKTLGGWEYRDPSGDFKEIAETAKLPTGKLIKSSTEEDRSVYVYNGKAKFPVPDMQTFELLFGKEGWNKIEKVESDVITKIPTGAYLPSMV